MSLSLSPTSTPTTVLPLEVIRDRIESMSKPDQIEVLRLLTKTNQVPVSENRYGTHINLSELPDSILEKLQLFISYIDKQRSYLSHAELEQQKCKDTYFGEPK